ncbi:MAG: hypothetical protein GX921_07200 [Bacteroidales bacterium]|nr:hypothetical protein [Bacteroidales bacterium]
MTKEELEELKQLRETRDTLLNKYKELAFEEMVNRKTIEKADKFYGTNLKKELEDRVRIHKETMKHNKTNN